MESQVISSYHPEESAPAVVHEVAERKSLTPMLDLAMQYLTEHPEELALSNRKIAEKLGISHPIVGQAKKLLKGE